MGARDQCGGNKRGGMDENAGAVSLHRMLGSKCCGAATPLAFKEMKRILKYTIDTNNYGLKMTPRLQHYSQQHEFELEVHCDSDWGNDKETRNSVTGFIIFLEQVPIVWKSRSQRTVALSSTEAEYIAVTDAAKEIKFIVQIFESIGLKIKKPININVDNTGAIFMSENNSATARTKHIDIKFHFIRQLIKEGLIKIIFIKSEDNKADPLTKNVSSTIYDRQIKETITTKEKIEKQ